MALCPQCREPIGEEVAEEGDAAPEKKAKKKDAAAEGPRQEATLEGAPAAAMVEDNAVSPSRPGSAAAAQEEGYASSPEMLFRDSRGAWTVRSSGGERARAGEEAEEAAEVAAAHPRPGHGRSKRGGQGTWSARPATARSKLIAAG